MKWFITGIQTSQLLVTGWVGYSRATHGAHISIVILLRSLLASWLKDCISCPHEYMVLRTLHAHKWQHAVMLSCYSQIFCTPALFISCFWVLCKEPLIGLERQEQSLSKQGLFNVFSTSTNSWNKQMDMCFNCCSGRNGILSDKKQLQAILEHSEDGFRQRQEWWVR